MENNTETIKKPRIEYIDAMRGFTMILVVFSHVCIHTFDTESAVNNIFILFRMPLFFFISGLMSYSIYTKQLMKKRIRNRILCQLLPTIIVAVIFCITYTISFETFITDTFKSGYWFTIVMVEFFLLYMFYVLIIKKLKINLTYQTIFLISLIFITSISKSILYRLHILTLPTAKILSLTLFCDYLPYFLFGILAKMHLNIFLEFNL